MESKSDKPNDEYLQVVKIEILQSLNEDQVASSVLDELGNLGWSSPWIKKDLREQTRVYCRAGVLVDAVPSEDPASKGQLRIRAIPYAILRERIVQSCKLLVEKNSKDGVTLVESRPAKWLVDAIHERGHYGGKIRPLAGIIESPTIRADGSILQTPGWDEATCLIYRPNAEYPLIPDRPTIEDAKQAALRLMEVICDFPFVAESDSSSWLAMVLTLIGRESIDGCVPMFGVSANNRGTGKGRVTSAAWLIAYGREAPADGWPKDQAEQQAKITSFVLEGRRAVLWDNIQADLGGLPLDLAITARTYSDRIKGFSKTTGEMPMNIVFVATGNNLNYSDDTFRRVIPIRMFTQEENPENRTGFKHPDLLAYVQLNRASLAVDALTILRAYFVAGLPAQGESSFGSFEQWYRIVRGALVWLGMADPMGDRSEMEENDTSKAFLRMIHAGLNEIDPDGAGVTAKQIQRALEAKPDEPDFIHCPSLAAAAIEACGKTFDPKRFGKMLSKFKGRKLDGKWIDSEPVSGVARWRLVGAENGFHGFHGLVSAFPAREKTNEMSYGSNGKTYPPNPPNPRDDVLDGDSDEVLL